MAEYSPPKEFSPIFNPDDYSNSSSSNSSSSGGGSTVITDYVDLSSNQTIDGEKTFSNTAYFIDGVVLHSSNTVDTLTASNLTATTLTATDGTITNTLNSNILNVSSLAVSNSSNFKGTTAFSNGVSTNTIKAYTDTKITLSNDITSTNSASFSSLTTSGDTSISGNLKVNNISRLASSGTINLNNNTYINGNLSVSGTITGSSSTTSNPYLLVQKITTQKNLSTGTSSTTAYQDIQWTTPYKSNVITFKDTSRTIIDMGTSSGIFKVEAQITYYIQKVSSTYSSTLTRIYLYYSSDYTNWTALTDDYKSDTAGNTIPYYSKINSFIDTSKGRYWKFSIQLLYKSSDIIYNLQDPYDLSGAANGFSSSLFIVKVI